MIVYFFYSLCLTRRDYPSTQRGEYSMLTPFEPFKKKLRQTWCRLHVYICCCKATNTNFNAKTAAEDDRYDKLMTNLSLHGGFFFFCISNLVLYYKVLHSIFQHCHSRKLIAALNIASKKIVKNKSLLQPWSLEEKKRERRRKNYCKGTQNGISIQIPIFFYSN